MLSFRIRFRIILVCFYNKNIVYTRDGGNINSAVLKKSSTLKNLLKNIFKSAYHLVTYFQNITSAIEYTVWCLLTHER